jgi:hypothetical protein
VFLSQAEENSIYFDSQIDKLCLINLIVTFFEMVCIYSLFSFAIFVNSEAVKDGPNPAEEAEDDGGTLSPTQEKGTAIATLSVQAGGD